MNREEIIRMALEVNAYSPPIARDWAFELEDLERFVALVAAAEAAKWVKGAKISIPTMAMEQEFSNYHRLGYKAGVAAERAENERLKRENSLLRKELRRYLMLDIQRTWTQASDEEAEEQAEKEIAWKILHNEGAE